MKLLISIVISTLLVGCHTHQTEEDKAITYLQSSAQRATPDIPLSTLKSLASGHNAFGFQLLSYLHDQHPINPLIAPYAVVHGLNTLFLQTHNPSFYARPLYAENTYDLHGLNALDQHLHYEDENGSFRVHSGLWIDHNVSLKKEGLTALKTHYGIGVYTTPMIDDTSLFHSINPVITKQTQSQLKSFIPEHITLPKGGMILSNSASLRMQWFTPFAPERTIEGRFMGVNGEVTVEFMHHERIEYPYYQGDGFQALELPPLTHRHTRVLFVIPDSGMLAPTLQNLPTLYATTRTHLTPHTIDFSMPKFDLTSPTYTLNAPLKALGIEGGFDPSSSLERLSDTPLYLHAFLHQNRLKMDENGSFKPKTNTPLLYPDISASKPFSLRLDRPFIVIISDEMSGQILLLGVINQPHTSG